MLLTRRLKDREALVMACNLRGSCWRGAPPPSRSRLGGSSLRDPTAAAS